MKKSFAIIGVILLASIASITYFSVETSETATENMQEELPTDEKIKVIASFYPYYEFTRNVAGENADVIQYLPMGAAPHNWEPRIGEIQSLKSADVFVYNGIGMEPYVDKLIGSGEFDEVVFIKASEGLNLIKSEDDDSVWDPHVWLDPILIKQQVNKIRDGLVQVDPENAKQYEKNAMEYNAKLDALDAKIRSSLAECKKDTVVPFHRAFTYFGERYDINIFAIGGLAPRAEATAAEIAEFVDYVKENDIKVIFAEDLIDPRLSEIIAAEAGAEVMIFSPIEGLTDEEMSQGFTFLDKMEQNIDALQVALECQ